MFGAWVLKQATRDDPTGEFARWALAEPEINRMKSLDRVLAIVVRSRDERVIALFKIVVLNWIQVQASIADRF